MVFVHSAASLIPARLLCDGVGLPGAAIYQPENLLRLPHVSFEGLLYGHTQSDVVELLSMPNAGNTRKAFEGRNQNGDEEDYDETQVGNNYGPNANEARWTSEYEGSDTYKKWNSEKVYSGAVFRRTKIRPTTPGDRAAAKRAVDTAAATLEALAAGDAGRPAAQANLDTARIAYAQFNDGGSAIWTLYSKNEGEFGCFYWAKEIIVCAACFVQRRKVVLVLCAFEHAGFCACLILLTVIELPVLICAGHLGLLDDPDQCDRLHGMHKFTPAAVRV